MRQLNQAATALVMVAVGAFAPAVAPSSASPGATRVSDTPAGTADIIGGRPVAEGTYPWMVRLIIGAHSCGGTLISPDIVLTAQHCVAGIDGTITADIGKSDWRTAAAAGQRRTATKVITGPGLDKGDWAIIRLTTPYRASSYMTLPTDTATDTVPKFHAIGWGMTKDGGLRQDVLRHVYLPRVTGSRCGNPPAEICAGDYRKGGIDTCHGDSGGPLFVTYGPRALQLGITSQGDCGLPKKPGHYARVSAFRSSINAAITKLGGKLPAGTGQPPKPSPTR